MIITRPLRAVLSSLAALLMAVVVLCPSADAMHRPEAVAPPRATHGATKLLVFVVENHSLAQMSSQMPWTYDLAKRYGYATDYRAMTHPSLPNYLAMAAGWTFDIRDDAPPSSHRIKSRSVFGTALTAGKTARVYAEDMPSHCHQASVGTYAVKHNPWAYFAHERRDCRTHDTSLARFAGDVRQGRLPRAGMVVPNLCNDAHDCALSTADAWLKAKVGLAMSGPDFTSGRLAIVITADESDGSQGNLVLTVMVHPSVRGVVTGTQLTHRSLCRLYTQVLGEPALPRAKSAHSMVKAFGLELHR